MQSKYRRIAVRLESRQFDEIKILARDAGFVDVASFVRTKLFSNANASIRQSNYMYEQFRGERRSFFCSNKLWFHLLSHLNGRATASSFIRQAIVEKMIKEAPVHKDIYEELLRN